MTNPFLSILITTYDRSFFLNQCLENIERSLSNSSHGNTIEIIVLNNGCTDDTEDIINRFKDRLPLRILREENNVGFINGILKCIDSATGRYCWFLGDDDYVVLDTLDVLIDCIEKNDPDILLMNHYVYIFEDGKQKFMLKDNNKYLMKGSRTLYYNYREYILDARHPNAVFCHIAPVIFRRDLWSHSFSKEAVVKHSGSFSSHIYVFLSMLKNAKKICYFRQQAVALCFGAPTDIFFEEPRYYRFKMNVIFFADMFREVFQERDLLRHYMDIMLKKNVFVLLLGSKVRCKFSFRFYLRIFKLLYHHYKAYPFFWYAALPILLTPRTAFLLSYRLFLWKSKFDREK